MVTEEMKLENCKKLYFIVRSLETSQNLGKSVT